MKAIVANNVIFTIFLSKCMQVNFRNFPTFVIKSIDFTKFSMIWYFHNMHCAFYFIDWVNILFEYQCIFYFFTTNYSPKIFSNIKVLFASFLFWHCLQKPFCLIYNDVGGSCNRSKSSRYTVWKTMNSFATQLTVIGCFNQHQWWNVSVIWKDKNCIKEICS